MAAYLKAVWNCRFFWLSLVRLDLRNRYRGSFLGVGWSLLQPIAMTVIICTMFSTIFHADKDFPPFVLVGMTFWAFFVSSTISGCQCFFQAEGYMRQHPAPLAIYPLRTVLGAAFHFLLGMIVVIPVAWYFIGNLNAVGLLSLIPALFLLLILGWCLAVIGGLMNVYFQDTQHLTEILFQILFYVTPIMYPPEMLRHATPRLARLLDYNPLVWFLNLVRDPIIYGRVPSPQSYMLASLVVLSLATIASVSLARCGRRVIFLL
jgi:ABC-type polysaccharide/polyol phosphate export permease